MPNKEAQAKLDAAVEEFLEHTGWNKDHVLTGWVLVGCQAGFDEQGEATSAYPLVYMDGSLPDHVALGLFDIARCIVLQTGRYAREPDDE